MVASDIGRYFVQKTLRLKADENFKDKHLPQKVFATAILILSAFLAS